MLIEKDKAAHANYYVLCLEKEPVAILFIGAALDDGGIWWLRDATNPVFPALSSGQ